MTKIEIYDPAMCCSTGVCGPGVDPELLRTSTQLDRLKKEGVDVVRHNLSEEPQAYVDNKVVNDLLAAEGVEALPITFVNGELQTKGSYPGTAILTEWTGVELSEAAEAPKKKCCCGGGKSC